MTEQPRLSFAVLLRQLRTKALLTQEELAEAASRHFWEVFSTLGMV